MVRARAALAPRRLRALADLPGRPRAALRRRRVDDRHRALPVRRHGQDQRPARGRRGGGARRCRCRRSPVSFARGPGGEPVRAGEIETPAYGNIHGLPRSTCALVGECDLGCNYGAKNTLDHTYLSAAQHARRRHPRPSRGQGLPAARQRRGRRLRGHVRRPHRRRRRARGRAPHPDHHAASAWCWRRARSGRRTCCSATARRSRAQRGARHPVLRQRRPARVRDERGPRRPRPRPGAQHRAGHHQRHPGAATTRTATARRGAATTSRTPATRPSPPGSPRPARASARSPGRSSSATGRPSRT